MVQRGFKQIDVFTDKAYLGNPLAIVMDGDGLDTAAMQHSPTGPIFRNVHSCSHPLRTVQQPVPTIVSVSSARGVSYLLLASYLGYLSRVA